jgi:hypothetical protein
MSEIRRSALASFLSWPVLASQRTELEIGNVLRQAAISTLIGTAILAAIEAHGTWATDNFGLHMLIDGRTTGQTSQGVSDFASFTTATGFVPGLNRFAFAVQDVGATAAFRLGYLVGTAANAYPELSSLLIAISAIGANRCYTVWRTADLSNRQSRSSR